MRCPVYHWVAHKRQAAATDLCVHFIGYLFLLPLIAHWKSTSIGTQPMARLLPSLGDRSNMLLLNLNSLEEGKPSIEVHGRNQHIHIMTG